MPKHETVFKYTIRGSNAFRALEIGGSLESNEFAIDSLILLRFTLFVGVGAPLSEHSKIGVAAVLKTELPSTWEGLTCQIHVECPQVMHKFTGVAHYTKPGPVTLQLCTLPELLHHARPQQLAVITCRMQVARITSHFKLPPILFNMATPHYKRLSHHEWAFRGQQMALLGTYRQPKVLTTVLDDVWILELAPDGDIPECRGQVCLSVMACPLPAHVSCVAVSVVLTVPELQVEHVSRPATFDGTAMRLAMPVGTMRIADFAKKSSLTMRIAVVVLSECDLSGNVTVVHAVEEVASQKVTTGVPTLHKESKDVLLPASGSSYAVRVVAPADDEKTTTSRIQDKETVAKVRSMQQQLDKHRGLIHTVLNKLDALASHVCAVESSSDKMRLDEMRLQMDNMQAKMDELLLKVEGMESVQRGEHGRAMVRDWLTQEVGLPQYYDVLIEHGFEDMESVQNLSMDVLDRMQISKLGHQMKLVRYAEALKKDNKHWDDSEAFLF